MTSALEVAKYIVKESIQRNSPVSNLKLQKLLYFVQGSSLVINKERAFEEDIIAWKYGPVVECVYYAYAMYGANDIIPPFDVKINLETNLQSIIDFVLENLLPISAIDLVNETHLPGSPWAEVQQNKIIPVESIENYFLEHYIKG